MINDFSSEATFRAVEVCRSSLYRKVAGVLEGTIEDVLEDVLECVY